MPNTIPQANDVDKLAELPLLVHRGIIDRDAISRAFGFDPRQSEYYREASESLGLVVGNDGEYRLTSLGEIYCALEQAGQTGLLLKQMQKLDLVNSVLEVLEARFVLSEADLTQFVGDFATRTGQTQSDTTVARRASSLLSWLTWMATTDLRFYINQTGNEHWVFLAAIGMRVTPECNSR